MVLCLQETNMVHSPHTIANYTMYHGTSTSSLIHHLVSHTPLNIVAPFSVLAATVSLLRTFTIASIYIPPVIILLCVTSPMFINNFLVQYYYWATIMLITPYEVPVS